MSPGRTWTVRFSDSSPFDIVHYPRIVGALHETADMFIEAMGFPFWGLPQDRGFDLSPVEIDTSFAPL